MILEYTDKNSEEKGHKFRTTLLMMQKQKPFFGTCNLRDVREKVFLCVDKKRMDRLSANSTLQYQLRWNFDVTERLTYLSIIWLPIADEYHMQTK